MSDGGYFSGHMALGDWLRHGRAVRTAEVSAEDQTKADRLAALNNLIGLPIVPTTVFTAEEVDKPSPSFLEFSGLARDRRFALRLRKPDGTGTLARNRGLSVEALTAWARTVRKVDSQCLYQFEPHVDADMSTILVLNDQGAALEAVPGSLAQLSKGIYDVASAYIRQGTPDSLAEHAPTATMQQFLADVLAAIRIPDARTAALLETSGFRTRGGRLTGYFEVIRSGANIYFADYNRVLGDLYAIVEPEAGRAGTMSGKVLARGRVGSPGNVTGIARVVYGTQPAGGEFVHGEILVCQYTAPELAPLMAVAAGVVTEIGGVLSHAAVLCRELGIPSIVGAKGTMSQIHTGDHIVVDAYSGEVRLLLAASKVEPI